MKKKIDNIDVVTLVMSCLLLVAFLIPDFISYLKSRVNTPDPVSAFVVLGDFFWLAIGLIIFFIVMSFVKHHSIILNFITGLVANLALAFFVFYIASCGESLPFEYTSSSRMSFNIGFVFMIIAFYGISLNCGKYLNKFWMKFINCSLGWILIFIMIPLGLLDNYSVMKEYAANSSTFFTCLTEHLSMCLKAIFAAIIIGIPTGYWCYRHRIADKIIILIISIFETMPMLALFALIRIPCAALGDRFPFLANFGVGSHGISVSVIALTLYALYLIILNSRAGFSTIDKEYLETASAMGMSSCRVFFKIQFPLALPIILGGIRLAVINTFTAAALAAYFGGGGFGRYINIGINGSALDAQLLGVIPIFVLTILADLLMKLIIYIIRYFVGGHKNDNTAECV